MAGGSAPRYAPADPSLPPPWKALVDGNTGYIYYWNTETNVTQYEKPLPSSAVPPLPPGPPPAPSLSGGGPKSASLPVVASPDGHSGKLGDKRSSDNSGMLPSAVASNPSRGESMHTMVSPQHVSGSGNRFSTSNIPGGPAGKFSENLYVSSNSNAPGQHQSVHMSDHHGRHMSDHHGRHMSDHQSRPMPDHHGGHMSNHHSRPLSNHHSGHMSDHHSRPMPDHHSGHMSDYGGHISAGGGVPRSGHAISGSESRSSGHNMPGGAMHVNNSDSSWGGSSGRHAYGSPGGILRGVPSTKNNQDGGGARGNVPKLAALPVPQRQQGGMAGMHYSDPPRQVGHSNSSSLGRSPLPVTPVGAFKRTASDYPTGAPDLHKRPRLQAFSEPSLILDVQTYRIQHEITVVGENVPPPFMTFDAASFPPDIHKELRSAGFTAPTPIQAQSWPIALQNRDLVAIAKTGSGKTLGYLLPAFLRLIRARANSRSGPIVLVLAPTRELATQIQDEAMKFGRSSRISSTCVYGGAPKGPQLRELERGADMVIATPGRLNDFLEVKKISLRQVSYLVLDEADRMLDMGFEPQIRKIVKEVPSPRQTLMFTATWPKEVRKIAADLLVNAVHVNIGNSDELTANKAITQHVEMVQPYEKQRRLEQILRSQEPGSKVIIFCSTKKMCDQLARNLARGFRAAAIHGDKSQTERDYVLAQFKAGRNPILVATDVAARGLDVKDIRVVINYDFPTGVEDYVHRIGRTGRAGATGVAFTFFSEQDSKYARELVKILESAEQKVPLELRQFAGRTGQLKGRGRWHAVGTSVADGLMDDRGGLGHRAIGMTSRDGNIRIGGLGHQDKSLAIDGAGGLGYTDGGMGSRDGGMGSRDGGRDRGMGSRGGNVGDRIGGTFGRDGRIGSRVEGIASRGGGMGRGGEINGAMGTRGGGLLGPRDGGFKISEGGRNDGWGDPAHGDDGWGGIGDGDVWGNAGRSDRWGGVGPGDVQGDTRPGDIGRRGGGRRDGWGDGGRGDGLGGASGGRGSFVPSGKQPEQRGRIFDRLGDRGRFVDKGGRRDKLLDERIHGRNDSRKFGSAKEETRSSGGSYSHSPSKGWGGSHSRSPSKGLRGSHSRSPSKGLGRSHSHSRSPSRGWRSKHSRSPSHVRCSDDHDGWSGSPHQGQDGLRSRSPASPRSLRSPRGRSKASKQASQLTLQGTEHGKAFKEHKHVKQSTLQDTEHGKASKENRQANQLTLPATEHTSSVLDQVTAPSLDSKPGTAINVDQTISPAGAERKHHFLLVEVTAPSVDSKLDNATHDSQILELDLPDEATQMTAHSDLGSSTPDSHIIEHHLVDHVTATEEYLPSGQEAAAHEHHPLHQDTAPTEISKVDFTADETHVLCQATTASPRQVSFGADQGSPSDQATVPNLDNRFATSVDELHLIADSLVHKKPRIATHGKHVSENHLSDKAAASTGFAMQDSDLSENHINDAVVSSPEEGMVL